MFFAITAFVVSAIQIAVGVGIGLSVAKHRRQQRATHLAVSESQPPAKAADRGDDRRAPARPQRPAAAAERSGPPSDALERQTAAVDVALDARTGEAEVAAFVDHARAPSEVAGTRCESQAGGAAVAISLAADGQTSAAPLQGPDRRVADRRAFAFRQFVAPYHGGALPGKASFREVECQDISSTGFSFLSTQVPDFDSLVVALGVPPKLTYLQAHIVNRFSVDDGVAPLYRIGCRFAGQVAAW